MTRIGLTRVVLAAVCVLAMNLPTHAAEHVTFKNGFEQDCVRHEIVGDKVRLYFAGKGAEANFQDLSADSVLRVEEVADVPVIASAPQTTVAVKTPDAVLTKAEMQEMLAHAGDAHNIDADLLASVVRAESGGQVKAVSRTGAKGLMQLMPGTANEMGVADAFRPEQNIAGGTAYLDALLTRYHDNVALALAAYNAGPGAVDKYHGVPPYRETRAYVARVIREFNRRKQMALVARAQ